MLEDIVYFVPGNNGRYINRSWKEKVTIGNNIFQEGYYIGSAVEKQKCWIFYGKPFIPSKDDIATYVDFDPNIHRNCIDQDTICYFLIKHKKSGAYFAMCRYLIDELPSCKGRYFSDLLFGSDGKWNLMEWPFNAERLHSNDKILEYWNKYGNYYEENFEIICELKGSCIPPNV